MASRSPSTGSTCFRILEGDLDADDGQTFDQARVVVTGRLDEAIAALQIMSPHDVLDPPAPVVVPKERWFEPPAGEAGAGGSPS
jgi:hypothetical protein